MVKLKADATPEQALPPVLPPAVPSPKSAGPKGPVSNRAALRRAGRARRLAEVRFAASRGSGSVTPDLTSNFDASPWSRPSAAGPSSARVPR
jgi:hypothetical protein